MEKTTRSAFALVMVFVAAPALLANGPTTDIFVGRQRPEAIQHIYRVAYDSRGFVSRVTGYVLDQPRLTVEEAGRDVSPATRSYELRLTWDDNRVATLYERNESGTWTPIERYYIDGDGARLDSEYLGTEPTKYYVHELLDQKGSHNVLEDGDVNWTVQVDEQTVIADSHFFRMVYQFDDSMRLVVSDRYQDEYHSLHAEFSDAGSGVLSGTAQTGFGYWAPGPRFVRSEPRVTIPEARVVNFWIASRNDTWLAIQPLFFLPTPGADGSPTIVASSTFSEVLDGEEVTYEAQNLSDYDLSTVWVEDGPGNGVGQWFEFRYDRPQLIEWIRIRNGFQANPAWYEKNARLKDFTVTIDGETVYRGRAPDQLEPFDVDLPDQVGEVVRITIDSAYPGTTYEDLVLTEVNVNVGYYEP